MNLKTNSGFAARLTVQLGALALASIALSTLAGCRVDSHKNGDNADVKIATPFGGMSVKTDDNAVQAGTGLAVYPGATIVKDLHQHEGDDKHDSGAADINMSFGSFHLGVKAVSYQTPDSPEKVLAFYRKDMARFGQVIFCRGGEPVGTPTVTQDGLTCSDDGKKNTHVNLHVNGDYEGSYGELKTGSKLHQRIVSLEAKGAGTKFGLVMLDLPGHLGMGDDKESQD
jgi:hypothetical protein